MNAWTVVLLAGLGSYVLRMSMIGAERIRLPERFDSALPLAAPAAFAALAMSSLAGTVLTAGLSGAGSAQAYCVMAAAVVGALATARTRQTYAAVLAGMPTYWLLTALIG